MEDNAAYSIGSGDFRNDFWNDLAFIDNITHSVICENFTVLSVDRVHKKKGHFSGVILFYDY